LIDLPRGGDLIDLAREGPGESHACAAAGIHQIAALETLAHLRRQPPAGVTVNEIGFDFGQPLEALRVSKVMLFQLSLLRVREFPEQVARNHLVRFSHRSGWLASDYQAADSRKFPH
jgi:hypothetical protein